MHGAEAFALEVGKVDDPLRFFRLQVVRLAVRDADDLDRRAVPGAHQHLLPDRIGAVEEQACGGFVDDRDAWRVA